MKSSDILNASEQFDGNNAFPLLAPVNVFLYLVTTARIVNTNRRILRMSQHRMVCREKGDHDKSPRQMEIKPVI